MKVSKGCPVWRGNGLPFFFRRICIVEERRVDFLFILLYAEVMVCV